MKILNTALHCRKEVEALKKKGKTVGLVPTMGSLHQGHLSLVEAAKKKCHTVFMTIFVNPTQFGPGEDFERYPRDLDRDAALAEKKGVDFLFCPEVGELYREGYSTYVEVEGITDVMCGRYRPGHFRGVATVVLKLFNIIPAHRAFFGEKDYQQLVVIKRMAADLDIDIEITGCPTVREEDGLALSSRNRYLDPRQRENAVEIYRALKKAGEAILGGEEDLKKISRQAIEILEKNPYIKKVDYFDIRDPGSLMELDRPGRGGQVLIAAAAWIGETRLIDNVVISKKK